MATILFTQQKLIAPISGLLNETLCTLVAQDTTKLWEVKVRGPKKLCYTLPKWVNLLNKT